MLVLSRKMGQELVIGDNIRITVSRIGGNRVTLGISAPNDVRIVRGELEPIVRSFEIELGDVSELSGGADSESEAEGPASGLSDGSGRSTFGGQVRESSEPLAKLVATPWVDTNGSVSDVPRHIH